MTLVIFKSEGVEKLWKCDKHMTCIVRTIWVQATEWICHENVIGNKMGDWVDVEKNLVTLWV